MPTGTNDERGLLEAVTPPPQSSSIIGKGREGVNKIIDVLDLGYWPQAAHGHTDGLPHDRPFPDAGVKDAVLTVLFL